MNIRSMVALCLLLPGCGVGGLLALSAGGGGGGGGGGSTPPPPTVTVVAPGTPSTSNLVPFVFDLRDPQVKPPKPPAPGEPLPVEKGPRVRVDPQFAVLPADAGAETWIPMTEAAVRATQGTRALPLGQHTFVWNTIVDLGGFKGKVRVRVLANYEDAESITRTFRVRTADFTIDNRRAATVFGEDVQPASDVDTFPVDMRPDGTGFLVASFGANIVERVDDTGRVERLLGYGVPGDTVGAGQDPGVVRLQTLVAFDKDAAGSLFTNHSSSLLVTNRSGAPFSVLGQTVPVRTTVRVATAAGNAALRSGRFHGSGAFLYCNNPASGSAEIVAVHHGPGGPITLAGTVIAPGTQAVIAGGPAASTTADGAAALATQISDAVDCAVGPDGEVYFLERQPGRVRVLNTGVAPIVVGGVAVAPATVVSVAGGHGLGFSGDGGPATAAQLNLPGGIDVSPARVLFIADTSNVVVRAANLGPSPVTFAQSTIAPGNIDRVVGTGGAGGGVGSRALEIALGTPNKVALDANGNLLVADQRAILLVNGGASSVTSYGRTAGPGRTASVYDSTLRNGLPLVEPRAVHAPTSDVLYFSDRTTVRVLNLGTSPAVFGGSAADPGATAVVAGGAVPGFAGDGGSARSAALSAPAALASEGPLRLYVADTGNDRVRLVNVDDPAASSGPQAVFGVVVAAGGIDTVAGGVVLPPPYGDGLSPTDASLSAPQGIAVSNAGLVFVADTGHHRVRVLNPNPGAVTVAGVVVAGGTIGTVMGGDVAGFTPDGPGPWLLDTPTALAVDRDLLYVADAGNARIRVLNLSDVPVTVVGATVAPGEVLTICGSGIRGNAGDFGLGVDAQIDTPRGFALQTLNSERAALYFADGPQHVVRMLNLTSDTDLVGALNEAGGVAITVPDSSVVSIAGGPNVLGTPNAPGFGGDGLDASEMRFDTPWGVAVTTFGGRPASFFVADSRNGRLRRFGAPPLVR